MNPAAKPMARLASDSHRPVILMLELLVISTPEIALISKGRGCECNGYH
jgi:hypothetical protein